MGQSTVGPETTADRADGKAGGSVVADGMGQKGALGYRRWDGPSQTLSVTGGPLADAVRKGGMR